MNYAELRAAAIAYADRYDQEVSNNIDTYILMTEARINRLLKTRKQSNRAYILTETDKEYYPLPLDWAGMRNIEINTPDSVSPNYSTVQMHLADPVTFEESIIYLRDNQFYMIVSDQIRVHPTIGTGSSIQIVYYQKVPHLRAEDINDASSIKFTTNWLSEDHPDIYLAGITAEISLFAKDYDAAAGWYERLAKAVSELDSVDWQERWSGDPLQVRLAE